MTKFSIALFLISVKPVESLQKNLFLRARYHLYDTRYKLNYFINPRDFKPAGRQTPLDKATHLTPVTLRVTGHGGASKKTPLQ